MLILISIGSSILAGMGIGGGAIFVLISTSMLNFSQKEAQALNLILFIAVGISTTISNLKNKNINLKIIKKSLPLLIIGSFIGTCLFETIENETLRKYFLYFLVIIGIYEIITSVLAIKNTKNNTKNKKKGERSWSV